MVTEQRQGDAVYVAGRSDRETRRLEQQGALYGDTTRRLFERAGLGPGMKVLDVGSGSGAVARMAGELVGTQGSVVGVDVNPVILETARAQAAAAGLTNVSFLAGDIRDIALPNDFDAVVGRAVLMYLRNPGETLRLAARHLRSGGVVAFQEPDSTAPPLALPPSRHWERMLGWWLEVARRGGVELSIGFKLRGAFLDAGLPEPRLHLDAPMGGGMDWAGYGYAAQTVRSILPLLVQYGIATEEEVGIETLEERFRDEVTTQNGVVALQSYISAWTHTVQGGRE